MTTYLTLESLLLIARYALEGEPGVRDYGLLESALARPQATVFGADAYPTLHTKAAALLHSLACNHALIDGNKRLAFHACVTFLWINGHEVTAPDGALFELVMSVADGRLSDVGKIGEVLASATRPR